MIVAKRRSHRTKQPRELAPNEIFVFGSNLAGRHGMGAARDAHKWYGAEYGVGAGMTGRTYALPTKDAHLDILQLFTIAFYVKVFLTVARNRPELTFLVTRVGCGLAGYEDREMAPLFKGAPVNCQLPEGWRAINGE